MQPYAQVSAETQPTRNVNIALYVYYEYVNTKHVVKACGSICLLARYTLHARLHCWAASCYNVARERHLVSETGRFLGLAQKNEKRKKFPGLKLSKGTYRRRRTLLRCSR